MMQRHKVWLIVTAVQGFGVAQAQQQAVPVPTQPVASAPDLQPVASQRVAFTGSMGNRRAVLVIDGGTPRTLAIGEAWRGVRLLSVDSNEAIIELDGLRHRLRMGAAAVNLGGDSRPGGGQRITLTSDTNGHFLANGLVNGKNVNFLVDTGATLVSIGQEEADRLKISYQNAPRVGLRTANGDVMAYRVMLSSVRLGDVDVHGVEAVVQPQTLPFILLGNSFLKRFHLRLENDVLTLDRR